MAAFTLTVHHGSPLLFVAGGHARLPDLIGMVEMASTVARMQGYERVLFDLITVQIQLTRDEHVELGQHAARTLAAMKRVASVVDPRFRVGTSEDAARTGGLQLRTFTSLAEASAWMVQP